MTDSSKNKGYVVSDRRLGVGAIVSFKTNFIHPHSVRDAMFPPDERKKGQRVTKAVVVRKEQKLINGRPTSCAIVTCDQCKNNTGDGSLAEIWVATSHIKVQKKGPESQFFIDTPLPEEPNGLRASQVGAEHTHNGDIEAQRVELEEAPQETIVNKRESLDPSGFDDPLRPRDGRDLMWKDVNMTLVSKHTETANKRILDDVWGDVPQKKVTAIMGPSGSGKTSLLNILAGRTATAGSLVVDADIRLNNFAVDPTNLEVRQKIAFVSQDDSLQVTATPREAIKFSAKMRLPKSMTEDALDRLTESMLDELGLSKCADVLVGGALLKGISGGERKRTSVGVELVAHPALVFLDEPTSGLDSHNALVLCQLLKKIANAGASVLLTIHQPSSEIFASLDRLILLNQGKVMYQGMIPDVAQDFADRGFPVPKHYNVADHVMRVALLNTEPELEDAGFFPEDTRTIAEAFRNDDQHDPDRDALGITKHSKDEEHVPPPGIPAQTRALFHREIKNLYRNTHALKTRTAMTLAISLVIGALFYQVAKGDFSEYIYVQSTFGALLMALTANIFATVLPALTSFPDERPVFLREYSTNHYSILSYFMSRLTMEVAISAIQVTISTIITYFMVGFSLSYWQLWTAVYLMALTSNGLGVMIGSIAETASTAMELLPAVFMPQILFSGFFVPPEIMPDWLAWITWIMPLTYGVKIIMAAEFGNGRCGDNIPNYCEQTLSNANVNTDDVWWYYLVLLLLFLFFRLAALFMLRRKASKFY
eukprot:CAMPEP_0113467786 /NCGR_PEP_ID=MMETSP0014_2-20120614/15001_1 /TAXON_ID=2857 /ORGANISM="Nitzschia sp." /LENGTH=765 /DNA_ID=CAMNT_0000360119 /DNA_START=192 /DNA_END=2489 /DNA_ORIENTATION=+ /assembly_acc=CAM_ASM_000159